MSNVISELHTTINEIREMLKKYNLIFSIHDEETKINNLHLYKNIEVGIEIFFEKIKHYIHIEVYKNKNINGRYNYNTDVYMFIKDLKIFFKNIKDLEKNDNVSI